MVNIIDGKKISEKVLLNIKEKVKSMKIKPGLAIIWIGNNPASEIYINFKGKACRNVGFYFVIKRFDKEVNEEELIQAIENLNQDKKIHGIIVQLPLPGHINFNRVINKILPSKDVDGLTAFNMGNLLIGNNQIIPATPKGIMKLIESTNINLKGKNIVIIGNSNIVGKPVSILLQQKNATVSICDIYTQQLERYTKQADVLIVAVGKPGLITGNMIKEGVVIIDVGINRIDNKLIGDVDFESVKKIASYITPVPGGVGPMTVAMLLENTLGCMKKK